MANESNDTRPEIFSCLFSLHFYIWVAWEFGLYWHLHEWSDEGEEEKREK